MGARSEGGRLEQIPPAPGWHWGFPWWCCSSRASAELGENALSQPVWREWEGTGDRRDSSHPAGLENIIPVPLPVLSTSVAPLILTHLGPATTPSLSSHSLRVLLHQKH